VEQFSSQKKLVERAEVAREFFITGKINSLAKYFKEKWRRAK
jgi:hypothetical protein